tara:strand:- start:439 stop:771 length:333 start_codon:yes stop_codon:yes gene_type:complete
MKLDYPCYEKPSVVSVERFLDEGMPALPALLGSMAIRSLLIAGGIWLAERRGVKNSVVKGLFAAGIIEGALFLDAKRQNKLRQAYHRGVESVAAKKLESSGNGPDPLKRG